MKKPKPTLIKSINMDTVTISAIKEFIGFQRNCDSTVALFSTKDSAEIVSESLKDLWIEGRGQVHGPYLLPDSKLYWEVTL